MELWIRSQDKTKLYKVNTIETDSEIESCKETGRYIIYINDEYFGTYKSKERALKILDEIQKLLTPKPIVTFSNKVKKENLLDKTIETIIQPIIEDIKIMESLSYVYEMPKE